MNTAILFITLLFISVTTKHLLYLLSNEYILSIKPIQILLFRVKLNTHITTDKQLLLSCVITFIEVVIIAYSQNAFERINGRTLKFKHVQKCYSKRR